MRLCVAMVLCYPSYLIGVYNSHPGFWRSFQEGLGTKVRLSTTFHPQTDVQAEHIIQTLEDMLRYCIIDFKENWEKHLPLQEFAYNNGFHSSISLMKPCMVGGVDWMV